MSQSLFCCFEFLGSSKQNPQMCVKDAEEKQKENDELKYFMNEVKNELIHIRWSLTDKDGTAQKTWMRIAEKTGYCESRLADKKISSK